LTRIIIKVFVVFAEKAWLELVFSINLILDDSFNDLILYLRPPGIVIVVQNWVLKKGEFFAILEKVK